jgi:hypothetical protein
MGARAAVTYVRAWAIWQAFMAAATTAVAGGTLADIVGQKVAGAAMLAVAAMQSGSATYAVYSRPRGGGRHKEDRSPPKRGRSSQPESALGQRPDS